MSKIGQIERITQNRIVKLFQTQLGYNYLGNWEERENNSNIEVELLNDYLLEKGYTEVQISKAIYELKKTANNYANSLYGNNKNVYNLLRYGIKVQTDLNKNHETIFLIDWKNPKQNHFAIAEEVTVFGNHEKRPDIVIYINGIAIGVLELKRSTVSITDGIRQSIVNQQKEFIESFFTTVQIILAGNDTEGVRYGTIGTPEKMFLKWKEDEADNTMLLLDKYLLKLCSKERIIELMHNFILFDGGTKKLPRHHQYFGIKAAQEQTRKREGGIIWHTQGSGKSIVMVLLAKWILENNPNARIAIITDRDELDKQIKRVFEDSGENIYRTSSGRDLLNQLSSPLPRLLCSLVHKFGKKDVDNFDEFITELENTPCITYGELFVFVDECHRTQGGRLHRVMKAVLKNAVFIGFTGTPLLKKDSPTTLEVFGKYIHTYKFNEAVADEVVLDLKYEARFVEQNISNPRRIDAWFENKTTKDGSPLSEYQKAELKSHWGTMQKVLSSKSRMQIIVNDIIYDFSSFPRLKLEKGNAILVAGCIFEACKYYNLFQDTELKNKCAIITSYNPSVKDINKEDTGADTESDKELIYNTYKKLLGNNTTEAYEDEAKSKFIKEPANMKLLVVVDKLLTGFDAPSCTYLYIDKSMKDHGLFQAICRVNRLDSDDKTYGYIIDYKNLFNQVENAVAVYTSELNYDQFEKKDCDILLQTRLDSGKDRLDKAIEQLDLLCEPVEPPKSTLEFIQYFCGNSEIAEDLKKNEFRRKNLYSKVIALIRAYANIEDDIDRVGYSKTQIDNVKQKVKYYLNVRAEIQNASGEVLNTKAYEADMRYLIDNFIKAEDSKNITPFSEKSLIEIIIESGIAEAINKLPNNIKQNQQASSETIANNVRQKIIKEHLLDPELYQKMSELLDSVIQELKNKAIDYETYLKKIADIVNKMAPKENSGYPAEINSKEKKALYNNLENDVDLVIRCCEEVIRYRKTDWVGDEIKEREIKQGLFNALKSEDKVEKIFPVIKQHYKC